MPVKMYHNPSCSKSRATLELLDKNGIKPNIIEYLTEPPSFAELSSILEMLGLEPRQLMRTGEREYSAANLDNPGLTRDELIQAMIAQPKLIERPIVVSGNKAAIGRPPESVLDIV